MTETFTRYYTVCDACEAEFEHSPDNWIDANSFVYCPLCGEELPDNNPRELEKTLGYIPPQRQH